RVCPRVETNRLLRIRDVDEETVAGACAGEEIQRRICGDIVAVARASRLDRGGGGLLYRRGVPTTTAASTADSADRAAAALRSGQHVGEDARTGHDFCLFGM